MTPTDEKADFLKMAEEVKHIWNQMTIPEIPLMSCGKGVDHPVVPVLKYL
jgi:hypothetical protein